MAARPASPFRFRGLVTQMFALIVLPSMVLLMATAYGGVALHNHAMQGLVAERDERAVRATARTLSESFAGRRLALQMLADRIADGHALSALLDETPALREAFDYGLLVTTADGTPLAADQPYFAWEPHVGGLTVVPTWQRDPANGEAFVLTAVRSRDQRLTVYAGMSVIGLSRLSRPETLPITSTPTTTIYLLAEDGQVLYTSAPASPTNQHPTDHPHHEHPAAAGAATTIEGEVILVRARVDLLNWVLVVREPWEAVTNPTLQLSLIAPLAAVPAVLIAIVALGFGLYGVVIPIRRLGKAASRLEWGEYNAIGPSVGGIQEVRDLQETLKSMATRLQSAQAAMRSYIGAVLQGQEDERRRLARELHDDTLQALIALDQRRGMAARALDRDPAKAGEHLATLHSMISEMIGGLRRLIRDMRPTYLEDLGLVTALEALCSQQAEKSGLVVTFQTAGEVRRLSHNQEMALYRISQEALQNAIRHARAKTITVCLTFAETVELRITDDGRGFSLPNRPSELAHAGHYGLVGMAERAEQAGGTLQIDSAVGAGTTIRVQVAA